MSVKFPLWGKIIAGVSLFLLVGGMFWLVLAGGRTFDIIARGDSLPFQPHPLTGQRCENFKSRPYAVMMAADSVTRPLSGIAAADLVVEMPVIKDGITRLMALFICEEPPSIGSVRSSRDDFIPLAAAFDAIYAHWGGSHFALDILNEGVIDNIDALPNPATAFIRKSGLNVPHDGFTSYQRLEDAAKFLFFRLETTFEGYKHIKDEPAGDSNTVTLSIGYSAPYNINYIYNNETNSYLRWRGGMPEYDELDGRQVEAKVIIVMRTNSRQLDIDYNDVDVTGEGDAVIFQNGVYIVGLWEKSASRLDSKLIFKNDEGNEIEFVAGNMWIEIVDYGTLIEWGNESL